MEKKTLQTLPILPLREVEIVVFPGLPCEIDVGREFSISAIEAAQEHYNGKIIVGIQNDRTVKEPSAKSFYSICTEAEIKKVMPLENNSFRVIVVGTKRAQLKTVGKNEGDKWYLYGNYEYVEEPSFALDTKTADAFGYVKESILAYFPSLVLEEGPAPKNSEELSLFVDAIVGQLTITGKEKLRFLRIKDSKTRLEELIVVLSQLAQAAFGNQMDAPVSDKSARGGGPVDPVAEELSKLKKNIDESGMSEEALKVAKQEFRRLTMMQPSSAEFQVAFNYVENLVGLPWNKSTEDVIDIENARKILDEDQYGLKQVKDRILEFLAVRKLHPKRKGSILCFYGAPGVGKTASGKSIARAMGRKFVRMSLGGVSDEAEIRGHRRTYVGAIPGRIVQNLKKVGVNNPVFMLDEVDKLCSNMRGDPASALLEVLDPEQNNAFTDNYLSVPFDLSNVLFIATVNEISTIIPALRDRLEIIEIPGYSPHDKVNIAKYHLIPKQKEEYGLKDKDITITDEAIQNVIAEYTSESGVRKLERNCGAIFRKLAVQVAEDKDVKTTIEESDIVSLLGPPKMFVEKMIETPQVGMSTGLAWSIYGGSLLFIETMLVPGKGDVKLTGNLGDVLKESASASLTWIKANHKKLGIDFDVISKNDIHIHLPAGATPKDGPSAGIAITSAMVSLLTGFPVRNDVAMTGEITLMGRVLPIGGVREKVLAAHRAGITTIIHPIQNHYDIDELPEDIKNSMTFIGVSKVTEAIDVLLIKNKVEEELNEMNIGDKDNLVNKDVRVGC